MQLFFGNIPPKTSAFELRRLVERELLPNGVLDTARALFNRKEHIAQSDYKIVEELKPDKIIQYGLASIKPELAAISAIKKLQSLTHRGELLLVRKFQQRVSSRDRRATIAVKSGWQGENRRALERRQQTLPPPQM